MANYLQKEVAAKKLARWLLRTNGARQYKNEIEELLAPFTPQEQGEIKNWEFNEPIV